MISHLLRLFLKMTRRTHLIQFYGGLNAIGKPGDVLYPAELLEQATLPGLLGAPIYLDKHPHHDELFQKDIGLI